MDVHNSKMWKINIRLDKPCMGSFIQCYGNDVEDN